MAAKRLRTVPDEQLLDLIFADEDSDYELRLEEETESEDDEDPENDDVQAGSTSFQLQSNEPWLPLKNVGSHTSKQVSGIIDYSETHKVIGIGNCTPFQCFQKLFPEEIYVHVVQETNRYAKTYIEQHQPLPPNSRFRAWTDVSLEEIKAFIALEISMGLVNKPTLASYFSKDFGLTDTPGFRYQMSRKRYELIRSCLHFVDNAQRNKDDRLSKIRDILDMVSDLYKEIYITNKEVSVDEAMLRFKGRLFWKQYMPKKPTKWGIKVWALCDSNTGYLLKFDVYTGKIVDLGNNMGTGEYVVQKLLSGFENKGVIVFMDNFFSGVPLYQKLLSQNTGACGTVHPNRKGLPSNMKKIKKKKGELPTFWISEDNKMIACSWQDSGRVNLLSTIGDTSTRQTTIRSKQGDRTVEKPSLQKEYNKFMGGVDRFDQFCASYPFGKRNKKWYQVLWYFIIEIALVNSWICYEIQNNAKMTPVKFRKEVIKGLLQNYVPKVQKRNKVDVLSSSRRLKERHFIGQYDDKKYHPNCTVCSISPNQCSKKGKKDCKRRQTSFYCQQCPNNPPLCVIPCFQIFHTVKNYKKKCHCT